jgi:hypothetical protein
VVATVMGAGVASGAKGGVVVGVGVGASSSAMADVDGASDAGAPLVNSMIRGTMLKKNITN